MGLRSELHSKLSKICENLYFQPPASILMKFPCIVYELNTADTQFANDLPYIYTKRYKVTVIDENPDSKIPDEVAKLPMCTFDRFYTSDNLNHFAFNLYF